MTATQVADACLRPHLRWFDAQRCAEGRSAPALPEPHAALIPLAATLQAAHFSLAVQSHMNDKVHTRIVAP